MSRHYAPKDVIITIAGYILEGKNEISVEPLNDTNIEAFDADGGFITTEHPAADHVLITLTLDQTSVDNLTLSTLHATNVSMPIGILDLNGNSTCSVAEARFKKRPTMTFAKDAVSDRVWTFIGKSQIFIDGGNS